MAQYSLNLTILHTREQEIYFILVNTFETKALL